MRKLKIKPLKDKEVKKDLSVAMLKFAMTNFILTVVDTFNIKMSNIYKFLNDKEELVFNNELINKNYYPQIENLCLDFFKMINKIVDLSDKSLLMNKFLMEKYNEEYLECSANIIKVYFRNEKIDKEKQKVIDFIVSFIMIKKYLDNRESLKSTLTDNQIKYARRIKTMYMKVIEQITCDILYYTPCTCKGHERST